MRNLGQALRRRREDLGASTEWVAESSRVAVPRLEDVEHGAAIQPSEFARICQTLGVQPATVLAGEETSPRRSFARFRQATALGHPASHDLRQLSVAAEVGHILGELGRMLATKVALRSWRENCPVQAQPAPWKQGYALGEKGRHSIYKSQDPIADIETLLAGLNVHVCRMRFSSPEIDAASLWEPDSVPVVVMNLVSPRVRNRLSRRAVLAHELCHLLHDGGEHDLTTNVSWNEQSETAASASERRARGFAPAFIAPKDYVKRWADSVASRPPKTIVKALAHHWGFSFAGAVWHAKNCHLIAAKDAQRMSQETEATVIDSTGFEGDRGNIGQPLIDIPAAIALEVSPLWAGYGATLVARAAESGAISVARAREILSWN